MLRNLLDDVVRRRLWPLLAVAALVAVAAPLLFLKSAPEGSPAAETAAPAEPETAKLPARAARLLATDDAAGASGRTKGKARDPFAPSSTQGAPAAPATTSATSVKSPSTTPTKKSTSGSNKPIPVVISNADGSSTTSGNSTPGDTSSTPSNSLTAENAAVAVRFSKTVNGKLHRAIPSKQAFFIRGKLVAVFVKYSPSRHKAVFAVAPGVHVSGPIECRVVNGVCRFLDIPAGSYARLTMLTAKREVVRRRLDVENITRRSAGQGRASAASSSDANACLLHKLEAMKLGSALVDRDACKR